MFGLFPLAVHPKSIVDHQWRQKKKKKKSRWESLCALAEAYSCKESFYVLKWFTELYYDESKHYEIRLETVLKRFRSDWSFWRKYTHTITATKFLCFTVRICTRAYRQHRVIVQVTGKKDCQYKMEWTNAMNEWMSEWLIEWMNEWTNEWMNEWSEVCLRLDNSKVKWCF